MVAELLWHWACHFGRILAHVNPEKTTTAGKLWAFAGLNPEVKWEAGQKRPWNARLKMLLVYKAGESFIKQSGPRIKHLWTSVQSSQDLRAGQQ